MNSVRISKRMTALYSTWAMVLLTLYLVKEWGITREDVEWAVKMIAYPALGYLGGQSAVDAVKAWRSEK